MQRFTNKTVIITGAGQGIGAAAARAFAGEGARVMLLGRTQGKVEQVAREISDAGGFARPYPCDVGDARKVQETFRRIIREYGADVLINNAAVHRSVSVLELSAEEWDETIRINLSGIFYCTKAVLPHMLERRYGKIINLGSSAARHYFPGFGAYAASKGGVESFTHVLSEEVKHHGINVNTVCLGMTNTEHTRERMGSDPSVTVELDEMMQPEQVARVLLFLGSDDAAPIMGAAIDVFGKKS